MGNASSSQNNLRFKLISNKNEAQSLLDIAEKKDFYLEECHDNKANSIARRSLTYSANSISDREFETVLVSLENLRSYAIPRRLLSDLGEVKIIQLMPTADGGMPHTRPNNIICFPVLSQALSKTTLIHELWHIHQRNYSELWLNVFRRLGWTAWDGKLPEQLEAARRFNPDTLDYPLFIFDNTWVPIPIFSDISKPNVAEVEIWYYNPQKRYHTRQIPSEIESYFPNLPASAYEHPREITAYLLSEPDNYKNSKGFKHLIEEIGVISIVSSENLYY